MSKSILAALLLGFTLFLTGCSGKKGVTTPEPEKNVSSNTTESLDKPRSGSRVDMILRSALDEWDFFGRQIVLIEEDQESMPHIGKWEDDGDIWSNRVNVYWRSVGKPRLDGYDCKQPWSAAFISHVMERSGLSEIEFPGSDAHWNYIRYFAQEREALAAFKPHKISEYAPRAGDLICATRGNSGFIPVYDAMDTGSVLMGHTKLHCDIVVQHKGHRLEAIGGNVRNSVSKTIIPTGADGKLRPTERRPWFVVLENKLPR